MTFTDMFILAPAVNDPVTSLTLIKVADER